MITRIFQDYDEAILYSEPLKYASSENSQSPAAIAVERGEADNAVDTEGNLIFRLTSGEVYITKVRPCAVKLFRAYEKMVGVENVYILTTSVQEYANIITRLAEFGIPEDRIIAREAIHAHKVQSTYGSGLSIGAHKLWDRNNVLIDNLPPRFNSDKIDLMGITSKRYIQVEDYYGNNLDEAKFMSGILDKLSKLL